MAVDSVDDIDMDVDTHIQSHIESLNPTDHGVLVILMRNKYHRQHQSCQDLRYPSKNHPNPDPDAYPDCDPDP